jgi:uroporphyrinogen-III synthase
MSRSLHGIKVAHFEARRAAELDGLISRHGGVPWSAPALSEVPIAPGESERAAISELASGAFDFVVLLTGIGTRRLFDEAASIGCLGDVIAAFRRAIVISRGPKPVPVLREHGLKPTRLAPEPHTTTELLATLDTLTVIGRRVLVLTAGETLPEPSAALRARGAYPVELQLYEWALSPTDAARIDTTVNEIIMGRIDAVLFTAQVQIRHLFEVAARRGSSARLVSALREHVLIGAVGPIVEQALAQRGLHADVVPTHPKMGHLVVSLADRVTPRKQSDTELLIDYVQAVLDGRGDF